MGRVEVPKTTPDWQGNPVPTTILQACKQVHKEILIIATTPSCRSAGNCRMCLVEVGMPAMGRDRQPVLNEDGSPVIQKGVLPYDPSLPRGAIACAAGGAQHGNLYRLGQHQDDARGGAGILLINHPLDCPICDQAGECKLQEYSIEHGQAKSQFVETKVSKPKQVDLGPRIMLMMRGAFSAHAAFDSVEMWLEMTPWGSSIEEATTPSQPTPVNASTIITRSTPLTFARWAP